MPGGVRARTYPKAHLSQAKAKAQLAMLLAGCTPERRAGFTAEGLAHQFNVPLAIAEAMLAAARKGRGE